MLSGRVGDKWFKYLYSVQVKCYQNDEFFFLGFEKVLKMPARVFIDVFFFSPRISEAVKLLRHFWITGLFFKFKSLSVNRAWLALGGFAMNNHGPSIGLYYFGFYFNTFLHELAMIFVSVFDGLFRLYRLLSYHLFVSFP